MRFPRILLTTLLVVFLLAAGIYLYRQQQAEGALPPPMSGITVFLSEQEISALCYDGTRLWVGTSEGVLWLDPATGEVLLELDTQISLIYTAGICRTQNGLVWVGHEIGLSVFEGEVMIASLSNPDIPAGRVNTVVPSPENGVWLGTPGGAAHVAMEDGTLQVREILTSENGLAEDYVNAIQIWPDGEIWFGAYLSSQVGGLSIRSESGWKYISTDEGLPHRYITAILSITGRHALVGTGHLDRGGLALLGRDRDEPGWAVEHTYTQSGGLPGPKIRALYAGADGTLWITTESDGILICRTTEALDLPGLPGLRLTRESGLSDNEIKVIVEAEGFYWLGGRYGLTRIERGTLNGALLTK